MFLAPKVGFPLNQNLFSSDFCPASASWSLRVDFYIPSVPDDGHVHDPGVVGNGIANGARLQSSKILRLASATINSSGGPAAEQQAQISRYKIFKRAHRRN